MKIDGACLCGHISYEAVIDPERVGICHCTDCQINSGTAYGVVAIADADRFTLLTGTLKVYEKIADSGTVRALSFCPECGTRVHATTVGEGSQFMGIRVGTIRQRAELRPQIQVWCRSALDWTCDLSDLPRFEAQPNLDEMASLSKR